MLFQRSYLITYENTGITNKISKCAVIKSKKYMLIDINLITDPKTLKFNETFEFSMISSRYSYNIHNIMFLLVSHYPDFLITYCIHAFENYIQSIVLYGPRCEHELFCLFW